MKNNGPCLNMANTKKQKEFFVENNDIWEGFIENVLIHWRPMHGMNIV